jgi:hypothetical protein
MYSDALSPKPAQVMLTPAELIERWKSGVSAATLATWRSRGGGPQFVKVGRAILYPLADIEAYELKHRKV